MPKFYAWDVAMIADVLLRGSAVFSSDAVYYATRTRPVETMREQIRRVMAGGLTQEDRAHLEKPDAKMGRFFIDCKSHILSSIHKSHLTPEEKEWTSREVERVFAERLDYIIP